MLDEEIAAHLGSPPPMPALQPEIVPMIRAGMSASAAALSGPELAQVRDLDADGVAARLYRPSDAAGIPLLVFLHGGGWMLGDLDTHDAMHRHLAARAGCAVLAVNYRLAPEHPFPAGLQDAEKAFAWARREAESLGCDPQQVALGGESAGANLTAAITLQLRDTGETQPLFQLLIHPVTDMAFVLPSIDAVRAPGLGRDYLEACRRMYVGDADIADPRISPLKATDHRGLAPAILVTAEEDPLRDDGEYYAQALVAAGVETLAVRLAALPHGFLFLPTELRAVDAAFDTVARLVRRAFAAA